MAKQPKATPLASILAKLAKCEPARISEAEMAAHIQYMRERGQISVFDWPRK